MPPTPATRARLAATEALRRTADTAILAAANTATPMSPAQRIETVRAARLAALDAVNLTVLAELLDGASWAQVAEAMNLNEETVRANYGILLDLWRDREIGDVPAGSDLRIGYAPDPDPRGTARALDLWVTRHLETPTPGTENPVSDLFG